MTGAPSRRRALLLGCGTFSDTSLAPLRSPRRDVEELSRVLRDPDTGRYTVTSELDCVSRQAQRAIEGFFAGARISDGMNLLYLSCHGVQDAQGRLYFAFADTEREFLSSTAVPADWVRERINASRSRATLVLVDCCFSGVFIKGMRARSAADTNVESLVRDLPEGSGVAVLTASGDTEISFEDADSATVRPSYFTDALISGIATGAADLNRDGRITVDELYDYIYEQVLRGPSPQRPRRLGMGEGVLVVADTHHPQSPSASALPPVPEQQPVPEQRPATSQPLPLTARGVLGWVSFDGQWVHIGKDGIGHVYKGERRYHVNQLSGVAVKPATRLHYGFFQVLLPGVTAAPVIRFGPHAGRPPMTDDNSISFARNANDDVRRIRDAVQHAINAAHGVRPASPSTAAPTAHEVLVEPVMSPDRTSSPQPGSDPRGLLAVPQTGADARSGPGRAPSAPSPHLEGRPPAQAARSDRPGDDKPLNAAGEQAEGENDGFEAAHRLPLAALDDLAVRQFDIVRWLGPWRQQWDRIASQPQPSTVQVPPWLPNLSRYLGGHAAPAGSTNANFTPSPAYLAGFCLGLRTAWNNAIRSSLLPADRNTFIRWMTQPPDRPNLPNPLTEATLHDLQIARRRARRTAAIRWTLRGLWWATTGLLLIMEIAAIGITIAGGWTDSTGKPAADQAPMAIIANAGCMVPLIVSATLIAIDVRRIRRRHSSGHPAGAADAQDGPQRA